MLMSVLKTLLNNLFLKNFNTTFIRNEKMCQNINYFFFFFIKTFFKWIVNGHSLALLFTLLSIIQNYNLSNKEFVPRNLENFSKI